MGHFYDRKGEPRYYIDGRDSTLRDAKKHGWLPSVTTIDKVIAAPQLTDWMVNQALDAALTLPRLKDESLDQFKVRALDDSRRQAREAAARGSELHDALEASFTGRDRGWGAHCNAVGLALVQNFGKCAWVAEQSFAHPMGFGGKCDLHAPGIVVDFKSKPRIEGGKRYGYDNHVRQLAAYAVGLDVVERLRSGDFDWEVVTLCNLFVGIEDAKVAVEIYTPAKAAKGWNQFRAALQLWKAMNNFDPSFTDREAA